MNSSFSRGSKFEKVGNYGRQSSYSKPLVMPNTNALLGMSDAFPGSIVSNLSSFIEPALSGKFEVAFKCGALNQGFDSRARHAKTCLLPDHLLVFVLPTKIHSSDSATSGPPTQQALMGTASPAYARVQGPISGSHFIYSQPLAKLKPTIVNSRNDEESTSLKLTNVCELLD